MSQPEVIIGYWNIRGLIEPIKLLLEYTKTHYHFQRYTQGDPPEYSRDEWTSVKYTLGLDFPNLPYFIEGDLKLTQSKAIIRYLAGKHGLVGGSLEEQAQVNMLGDQIADFANEFGELCYNESFEEEVVGYMANIACPFLERFEMFLGDKTYLMGDHITWPDFTLYEALDVHSLLFVDYIDTYPLLRDFRARIKEIPAIKNYLHSDRFKERPVNNKVARWK